MMAPCIPCRTTVVLCCPVCGSWFEPHKRQRYCSPACSQRFRTRQYRTRHQERFRQKRREAYAKRRAVHSLND